MTFVKKRNLFSNRLIAWNSLLYYNLRQEVLRNGE